MDVKRTYTPTIGHSFIPLSLRHKILTIPDSASESAILPLALGSSTKTIFLKHYWSVYGLVILPNCQLPLISMIKKIVLR